MSISDRLDQIEQRASAATEGPWEKRTVIGWEKVVSYGTEAMIQLVAECRHDECDIADAEFIAHARADVPALVSALRAVLAIDTGDNRSLYGVDFEAGMCKALAIVHQTIASALGEA